ncbi:hypothetical protein Salat_2104500, partial [Sesamum alatum]
GYEKEQPFEYATNICSGLIFGTELIHAPATSPPPLHHEPPLTIVPIFLLYYDIASTTFGTSHTTRPNRAEFLRTLPHSLPLQPTASPPLQDLNSSSKQTQSNPFLFTALFGCQPLFLRDYRVGAFVFLPPSWSPTPFEDGGALSSTAAWEGLSSMLIAVPHLAHGDEGLLAGLGNEKNRGSLGPYLNLEEPITSFVPTTDKIHSLGSSRPHVANGLSLEDKAVFEGPGNDRVMDPFGPDSQLKEIEGLNREGLLSLADLIIDPSHDLLAAYTTSGIHIGLLAA